MKCLVTCAVLIALALAEPPVDNRYLPPNHGFNGGGLPPPSESYGPPGGSRGPQRQTDAVFSGRPSSNYGPPSGSNSRSSGRRPSNQYGPPQFQNSQPSNQYGTPNGAQNSQNSFGSQQPSNQYGVPSQNSFGSSQPSNQYGAPSFGSQMGRQGLGRMPGVEYGAPSGGFRGNQQNSHGNGVGGAQSRQYLPPNGENARGGYGGDDEGNGEPANYNFEYMVKDDQSGNDFGHRESRQGDRTEGRYYVLLPDGRRQVVEYEADQNGYKPRISYEDVGTAGGYDRNSQGNQQGGNRQGGYQNGYQNGGGGGPY